MDESERTKSRRKERERAGTGRLWPGTGTTHVQIRAGRAARSLQARVLTHHLCSTESPTNLDSSTSILQHGFCEANAASESVSASYHTCALRSCIALQAKLATRAWQTRHLSARACAQNRGRRCRTLSPLLLQHPRRLIVSARHAIRQQRPRRRSRPTHGRVSTA